MDRPSWMTDEWLEEQKRKLCAERDRLRGEIEAGADQLGIQGTASPREPGDIAEEDREDFEVAGTMEVSQSRFSEVEDAIARIAEGSYGRCADHGGWISRERLEAIPAASRCLPRQPGRGRGEAPGGRDRGREPAARP